jgi:hypothetical protein
MNGLTRVATRVNPFLLLIRQANRSVGRVRPLFGQWMASGGTSRITLVKADCSPDISYRR